MQSQPRVVNINVDDEAVVQQCRLGDTAAMERLILKYQDRIYNVVLKICANADDAAELTQETFVKILENISKFQGKSSFYTWAFRIAVNLTLNHCKRNVRVGFSSLDAEDDGQEEAKGALKRILQDEGSPDPAIVAQNKELCELIKKSLMKLDEKQRTIIVLRDIEAMSYESIAGVLELELGTVKSRLSRARSNLREILEVLL